MKAEEKHLPFQIESRFQLEDLGSGEDCSCLLLALPMDPLFRAVIAARRIQRCGLIIPHVRVLFIRLFLMFQVR